MINWRIMPFVRITIAFMSGIFLAENSDVIELNLMLALVLLLCVLYVALSILRASTNNSGYWLSYTLFIVFLILGVLRTKTNKIDGDPAYFAKHWSKSCSFVGIINEIPKVRSSAKTQIDIVELIDSLGTHKKACGRILAYFSINDSMALNYKPGDKIQFQGKIREVKEAGNPKSFDYKSFLKYRHILYQVFIPEENHSFLSVNQLSLVENIAYGLRQRLLHVFSKYIKEEDRLAVVSALILGYTNTVSDDLYQAFSDSGALHVLSVSGMHVGIVASAFLFILDRVKIKQKSWKVIKLILLLGVIWLFSIVTGAAPAVMRSAVMFTMIWVGRYWFDYQNIYNILAFSALIMLAFDPYLLFNASFQFSYTSLLSLMFFQPYIFKLILIKNKPMRWIWEATAASISAQILVSPIAIYLFHKFPLYFILSGVVCVMTGVVTLYLGLIVIIAEFIFYPLNIILGKIFSLCSYAFIESVKWVTTLPFASLNGLWLSNIELVLLYFILIGLMHYLVTKYVPTIYFMSATTLAFLFCFSQNVLSRQHYLGFTVYDSYNATIIDFFDGNSAYQYSVDILSDDVLKFVCNNNRYFHGVKKLVHVDPNADFEGLRIKKDGPIIRLMDKSVYIVQCSIDTSMLKACEYIIVSNDTKWPPKIQGMLEGKKVILCKGKNMYLQRSITKDCTLPNCNIYDINNLGAFDLEIK